MRVRVLVNFRLLVLVMAAACGVVSQQSSLAKKPHKPDVLFISVDDMKDWVGCLGGHPDAKTPNIDRLAQRGTLFTNAHCAATTCNPSRAATMTGLLPSTTGIYGNAQWFRPLLPNVVTI
ncbi:uncharacterized protein METZ01_LOCUS282680, partial [marine metagenome]